MDLDIQEDLNAQECSTFLAAIFFSWLLAIPVLADLTGDVQGTVTDGSGARVAVRRLRLRILARSDANGHDRFRG